MTGPLDTLRGRSAILFLAAGILLLVFGALLGFEAVTGGSAPEDVFGPPGYAIAAIGLLALYPRLAGRNGRLASAGAVAAAIGAAGWAVLSVLSWLEVAGVLGSPEEMVLGGIALAATGLGMILGYPLLGAASLRSEVHPRTVGLLLLAPPAIFVLVFAVLAPLGFSERWGPFIAGTAQAIAHLAIGAALRTEDGTPSEGEMLAGDRHADRYERVGHA